MEKLTFVHKMMGKRGQVQNDFRMVMKMRCEAKRGVHAAAYV